jgi:hypothetical protein
MLFLKVVNWMLSKMMPFSIFKSKDTLYAFRIFHKKENSSYLSAKLHSYCFRLWLNYGYGKKASFSTESGGFPGKRKKERVL